MEFHACADASDHLTVCRENEFAAPGVVAVRRVDPLHDFSGIHVDQFHAEQGRRVPLRQMDAARKRQALLPATLNGDHLVQARIGNGRKGRINVLQSFPMRKSNG